MKALLLYGIGEVSKRNELLKIKKSFPKDLISVIDLKEENIEKLETVISSTPLFDDGKRLIIVENTPSGINLSKLKSGSGNTFLIVVAGQLKSDAILLKSAKEIAAKIMLFEGDREVSAFPYLDNLIEKKKQAFLNLEELLTEYGGMYVLAMIYYLLRRNILPPKSSSFMKRKIEKQKKNYRTSDWEKLYKLTLEAEYNIKMGLLPEKIALTKLTEEIII